MNTKYRSFLALFRASMRMYFRNKSAVYFTLIFPLALLAVFGFLSRGGGGSLKLDITNYSNSQPATQLVQTIQSLPGFTVTQNSEAAGRDRLDKGNTDLQVIIPEGFGVQSTPGTWQPSSITTYYNQGKPQTGQTANLVLSQLVSEFNNRITGAPQLFSVRSTGVSTHNLGYFDFILPGLLAMTIMQSGIFAVAFAFVSFKASGALRRIQATPTHPIQFVFAQALTRLIITLATIVILVACGTLFFHFHMIGSYLEFGIVALFGILIFLGFGFAIAGYAKDENQVAPLANIVQLPMLLLSGIFFSRDLFPHWLQRVTDFLPLTYVSDGMRHIANEGLHLTQIGTDLLGMTIWTILVFALAVKVFRWE